MSTEWQTPKVLGLPIGALNPTGLGAVGVLTYQGPGGETTAQNEGAIVTFPLFTDRPTPGPCKAHVMGGAGRGLSN